MKVLGISSGVLGVAFCLLGLALGIELSYSLVGVGSALSLTLTSKMVLLEIGALLLFLSALTRGKEGRMYQVLEAAVVVYGVIYFLPWSVEAKVILRICCSAGIIFTLWKLRLFRGTMSKLGAAGLEFIGVGQLFDSSFSFAIGGWMLTIYSAVAVYRHGGWINKLWLTLNIPFGLLAFADWLAPAYNLLGATFIEQLIFGYLLMTAAALVFATAYWTPWFDLEGPHKPMPTDELPRPDLYYSWDEKEEEWIVLSHLCGTRYIDYDFCTEAEFDQQRAVSLNKKEKRGAISPKESEELEKLRSYLPELREKVLQRMKEHPEWSPKRQTRSRNVCPQ